MSKNTFRFTSFYEVLRLGPCVQKPRRQLGVLEPLVYIVANLIGEVLQALSVGMVGLENETIVDLNIAVGSHFIDQFLDLFGRTSSSRPPWTTSPEFGHGARKLKS